MPKRKHPFWWHKRQRDSGKIGTCWHAYRVRSNLDCEPAGGERWVPICGVGRYPLDWAVHLAAVLDGEPMPADLPICAACHVLTRAELQPRVSRRR